MDKHLQSHREMWDALTAINAESADIAAQHPAVVKKMQTFLATARTESPYWPARPSRGKGGKSTS